MFKEEDFPVKAFLQEFTAESRFVDRQLLPVQLFPTPVMLRDLGQVKH